MRTIVSWATAVSSQLLSPFSLGASEAAVQWRGLPPDSPDWGSTINAGRQLLSVFPHPALVPAVALLSLVLGLNLLADGLREESMRD